MRKSNFLWAVLVGVAAGGYSGGARAATTILYDSGGFESPRFSTSFVNPSDPTVVGDLRGQDAAVRVWEQAGVAGGAAAGTAVVQTGVVQSGLQAVQVTRTSNDERWAPSFAASPIVPGNGIIAVDWDMRVTQTTVDLTKFGPFFGIESYGGAVSRLGGLGVDATTGEVLFEDPVNGFSTTADDATVAFGQFNHFTLDYDFSSHTYSVSLNGVVKASGIGFLDGPVNTFTDADIAALVAAPAAFANDSGVAYFDNYVVSLITPDGGGGSGVPLPAGASSALFAMAVLSIGSAIVKLRKSAQAALQA